VNRRKIGGRQNDVLSELPPPSAVPEEPIPRNTLRGMQFDSVGFREIQPRLVAPQFPRCRGTGLDSEHPDAFLSAFGCAVRFLGFTLARVSCGVFHLIGDGANHSTPSTANAGGPTLGHSYYARPRLRRQHPDK